MFDINQLKKIYNANDVQSFINYGKMTNNPNNIRDLSFDYCFDYFQTHKQNLTADLERSCMALWSYLASWGMLRGSSSLLQKGNYKVLENTINVIQNYFNQSNDIPDIVNDNKKEYVNNTIKLCEDIKNSLISSTVVSKPSNTLITKIVLGVFGAFPALDQNFCRAFGEGSSIPKFADVIKDFYDEPSFQNVLNNIKFDVKKFNGSNPVLEYPVAKLIDMFGFFLGGMVHGRTNAITFDNLQSYKVYVNNILQSPNNNSIRLSPGSYSVEIEFQNSMIIKWQNVVVK